MTSNTSGGTGRNNARLADELTALRHSVGAEIGDLVRESGGSPSENTFRNIEAGRSTYESSVLAYLRACTRIARTKKLDLDARRFDSEYWLQLRLHGDTTPAFVDWVAGNPPADPPAVIAGWAGLVTALDKRGELPSVTAVDPYRLGATESRYGDHDRYDPTDRNTAPDPYVPRRVDTDLSAAISGRRLTVLIGPSKAGKTRTLFEALVRTCPGARMLVPAREKLDALAEHPAYTACPEPIVVWLDDLDRFLTGPTALTSGLLTHLLARPAPTAVVATLRREAHDRFHDVKKGELAGDVGELLRQATIVELESTITDPAEQAAAEATYPDADLDHYRKLGYGLGEVLAGAPAVLDDYDRAARNNPPLRAVIETAIDWARIGRFDLIPESTLTNLAAIALRRNWPEYDSGPATITAAIRDARTRVEGHAHIAALTSRWLDDDARGYRAFDYLVDADDGQHNRTPRPIPEPFWRTATHYADNDTFTTVGAIASLRGHPDIAYDLTRKAADNGNADAMFNLGLMLRDPGDLAEAETWYRKAAEAGHIGATINLGIMLEKRGDVAEAESWVRKAADTGDPSAMFNLASMLQERGADADAETWYRKAADTGHPGAMTNLGVLLVDRGDVDDAETWYRKAADTGSTDAMTNLGNLLVDRGDVDDAETWYRKAIDAGDIGAMINLGNLLVDRGDVDDAETWYRKAIDDGHIPAMVNFGFVLTERGDVAEAETWFRKAADAGDIGAMTNLGVLLKAVGDVVGAEAWWRKAADVGSLSAITNLATLFEKRGDYADAETWYRKAANAKFSGAMFSLANLLHGRGAIEEAWIWRRRASAAGDPRALAWFRFS